MQAVVSGFVDRVTKRHPGRHAHAANANIDRALLERQRVAFARTAGVLKDAENPDWETPEQTSAWVEQLRQADDAAARVTLSSHPRRDTAPAQR
ncbi:MAG: hypothetical protein ACYDCQ_14710 [Dehalococcoidia bacterium]